MENLGESNHQKTESVKAEDIKKELFTQECPEKYRRLIKDARFIRLKEPYAESLRHKFFNRKKELSELGEFVSKKINGKIVLDLGCGKTSHMSYFSKETGAKLHIGVDLSPDIFIPVVNVENFKQQEELWAEFEEMIRTRPSEPQEVAEIPEKRQAYKENIPIFPNDFQYSEDDNALQIRGDMLGAISQIRDNSIGVIIISGIETSSENRGATMEYIEALEKEIMRVLITGGIAVNYDSDFNLDELKNVNNNAGVNESRLIIREKEA